MKNNILKTLFLLLILVQSAYAEEHKHGEWEVGLSLGYANLVTENEEGKNIHLHVAKRLGEEGLKQYFSVGLGAEMIVTDEKHYGTMLTLAWNPVEDLTIALSPSIEWANHDGTGYKSEYATHMELSYVFDVTESMHIGPALGYSATKDAEHYSLGLHFGFPF